MIKTKDGVIKKRGEVVYEIAYCLDCKIYKPIESIVHRTVQNKLNAFSTKENCQKLCNEYNVD